MNKATKLILLFVLSIGIGSFVIIFQKEIISGIIIIFGGMSLSASNYFGWLKKLYSWLDKVGRKKEQSQEMGNSPQGTQQLAESKRDTYQAGRDIYVNHDGKDKKEGKVNLKIYYDKDETYHNVPIVNIKPVKNGIFLHVMVKNEDNSLAKNCYGELVDVQEDKNGTFSKIKTFTAPVILKWAHEDVGSKLDIDKDISRRLDICHTIDGFNHFLFMTSGGPRGIQTQFHDGKYKIKVRVKGDNADFSYGEFIIDFDGNWKNIKLNNI